MIYARPFVTEDNFELCSTQIHHALTEYCCYCCVVVFGCHGADVSSTAAAVLFLAESDDVRVSASTIIVIVK